MRLWVTLLCCIVFLGCEKDPEISDEQLNIKSLENYLLGFSETQVSNHFVIFAGNHDSFEEDNEDQDLHILIAAPDGATDFRVFQSDSLDQEDSTAYYLERSFKEGLAYEAFLTKLSLSFPNKEKWIRVSCATEDSLFLSDPIRLPGKDGKTLAFDELEAEQELPGKATFRWNDGPFTPLFLFLLTDRSGDVFCAVTTEINRFRFYDLRNIERDLSPDLFDPQLVEGEQYKAVLFGISSEGWLDRYRTLTFIHE